MYRVQSIQVQSLNVLNFVYIVVFDVKKAMENAKLVIPTMVRADYNIFSGEISPYFAKTKMASMYFMIFFLLILLRFWHNRIHFIVDRSIIWSFIFLIKFTTVEPL